MSPAVMSRSQPSADSRDADDKWRKQTVGTFLTMLIELGVVSGLGDTYCLTRECHGFIRQKRYIALFDKYPKESFFSQHQQT